MKQIWMEGDKDDDHALADDLCWIAVALVGIILAVQIIRVVLR